MLREVISEHHHSQKDCILHLLHSSSEKESQEDKSLFFDIVIPLEHSLNFLCFSQNCVLEPEDILFLCPNITASIKPEHDKCLILRVPLSLFYTHPLKSYISTISPIKIIKKELLPKLWEQLISYIRDIVVQYYGSSTKKDLFYYTRLVEIILALVNEPILNNHICHTSDLKQKDYSDKFMQICDYINEHYASLITLEEVADLAGFSKFHFSRLFKQFTGYTFYQYLNNKRIMTAEILLKNPNLTITDVALHSGFPNISSFIRMFKLHNKCTPSEFRVGFIQKV